MTWERDGLARDDRQRESIEAHEDSKQAVANRPYPERRAAGGAELYFLKVPH